MRPGLQVAIFHSGGEPQAQLAQTIQNQYHTQLNINANIFNELSLQQRWGWRTGGRATLHFVCGRSGFDGAGRFYLAVGAGGAQRLRVLDVARLLLQDMQMSRVLVVLDGLEAGEYASRVVASMAAMLEQAWREGVLAEQSVGSQTSRALLRLVVAVGTAGRPCALSGAVVAANAFEGASHAEDLSPLYAATAGTEVYLLQRSKGEFHQLCMANRVLHAAARHSETAGPAGLQQLEATVLFQQCNDDYSMGKRWLQPAALASSLLRQQHGSLGASTSLPALTLGLRCAGLQCDDTAVYNVLHQSLVEMWYDTGSRAQVAIVSRQCVCAAFGLEGEPAEEGDELVAVVAFLLLLNPRLLSMLRRWRRALLLRKRLLKLQQSKHMCDLRSREYDPLVLLRAAEGAGGTSGVSVGGLCINPGLIIV